MYIKEKTLLILGSPRSGTSLTSGIVNIMGIDLGNCRKPDSQNPTGYFEDIEISRLCDKIIMQASPNANGFNLPSQEKIKSAGLKLKNEIKNLINYKQKQRKTQIWGWKTITTSALFDLFIPYIKNPHLIIVLRNPLDIAKSISVYTQYKTIYTSLSIQESLKVVFDYYSHIADIVLKHPNIPVLFISYEDILSNYYNVVMDISHFLEIEITQEQLIQIKNLIKTRNKIKTIKKIKMINEKIFLKIKKVLKHF